MTPLVGSGFFLGIFNDFLGIVYGFRFGGCAVQSVSQSVSRSVGQPTERSVSQSVSQPSGQAVSQSVVQRQR